MPFDIFNLHTQSYVDYSDEYRMELARKMLGQIAVQDRQNKVLSVDLAGLLTRLFLFDTFILHSIWLEDLILLQHSFEPCGLSELCAAGALKFECPSLTFGQIAQARSAFTPPNGGDHRQSLPLFRYQFSILRVQGAEERIERTLSVLEPELRSELTKARIVEPPDYSKSLFDLFYQDLNSELLNLVLKAQLRHRGIIPVSHELQVEKRDDDEFVVHNNLRRTYSLPDAEAHTLIENAMMAVGRMDQHLINMHTHSTLVGLGEEDKMVLEAKVGISGPIAAPSWEQQFTRVVALKGFPVPEFGSTVINVKALLKARESDECKAFKAWLTGAERLSDKELHERVLGFGRRVRSAMQSRVGKAIRFIVSNGIGTTLGLGVAPAPVAAAAGIALSAIDSFLIDLIMPKDSVLAFLAEEYPAVFERRRRQ